MLLLKGLECLLLLLLAGPARLVSAEFACEGGRLYDPSTCRKEDLIAVFGAIWLNGCDSNFGRFVSLPGAQQLFSYSKSDCRGSAGVINGHADYDGPAIGCATVSALLPFGGEIATNWGIRW